MPFADSAQAQNKSTAILRRTRLVGVADDARVEQGRRLERVFVKKIRANQAAPRLVQCGMRLERLFHFRGTGLENLKQIPVAALEILQHLRQLPGGSLGLELKYPIDNMIGPSLIGWIEISGFGRRLKRSDNDPRRIRTKV
jgi:hypothetical protein